MDAGDGMWILQANPDRFEIDRALRELEVIDWRIPQYAAEIQRGDGVVIWRSGPEAGVVGIGRVTSRPREAPLPDDERPYATDSPEGGRETRAPILVRPVQHVPKEAVGRLPAMSDHPIVTAPMGTVFPLAPKQWSSLSRHLPDPREVLDVGDLPEEEIPRAFAWNERSKSVFPLPGGIEEYAEVLRCILEQIRSTQPEERELISWVRERYAVSEHRSRNSLRFLQRLSLVRRSAARLDTTTDADRWLETGDDVGLLALVHSRTQLIGELLVFLEEPRTPEDLLDFANNQYGMGWSTRAQVDRRRALLGGLGAIEMTEDGRLVITELGRRVRDRIEVADPRPRETEPTRTMRPEEEPPESEPESDTGAASAGRSTSSRAEELVRRLQEASHQSGDPAAFEKATRDAFAFLGFEAEWAGGAGNTDVLLVAPLSQDDRYRVIIDTKSTSHEAVSDAQVDWETLDEHKERYEADYVALVAPAFKSGRLEERATARQRRVVLIDVPALAELLRQHDLLPLDLLTYRRLFEAEGGPEVVGEEAEEQRRAFLLADRILSVVNDVGQTEGALSARDLYWNIDLDEESDPPSVEEIEDIASGLAARPFQLLRKTNGRYSSVGTHGLATRRLTVLSRLLQSDVP